jgi:hypothetical protein
MADIGAKPLKNRTDFRIWCQTESSIRIEKPRIAQIFFRYMAADMTVEILWN